MLGSDFGIATIIAWTPEHTPELSDGENVIATYQNISVSVGRKSPSEAGTLLITSELQHHTTPNSNIKCYTMHQNEIIAHFIHILEICFGGQAN